MNKKMIISIIAGVVVLFLAFAIYNANQLKNITITKQVTIDASQQEVFDMVRYLENFPKWSPFLEADPDQKYEVKGEDGTVGAQYHWEGNGGKDLGYQEIARIDYPTFVGMRCDIQKPFQATPTFDYTFSNGSDGVTVTQEFNLESDLVSAFFMWAFGAKKEMEETNERGLTLLKASIEG